MAGAYSNVILHIVFSTHGRYPFIDSELQERLYEYMGGIIRSEGGVLYEIGGMPDHVHMLVRWRPEVTVSELIRKVKSNSTGWVRRTFPQHRKFQWQRGYGAFSVSCSQIAAVRAYIRNQKEHHRRRTFEEEFLSFLHVNETPYDSDLIWR